MAVLLIADLNEGHIATDAVAKTLAAVGDLGEVHVLIAGTGGDAAAAEAATRRRSLPRARRLRVTCPPVVPRSQ